MNISIIGTGYVGLVAGACLAESGMSVICVDNDEDKIAGLQAGEVPIHEIGLSELVQRNLETRRLSFTTDLNLASAHGEVILLAVGTPEDGNGKADLTQVLTVAEKLASKIDHYKVIVTKSTVPVGTASRLRELFDNRGLGPDRFAIVSNPEFLREGSAVEDFLRPDRVVIGSDSEAALDILEEIYRPILLETTPVIRTTNETAELIKYAANTMLALKLSFINEIANLCDEIDADVSQVALAVGLDRRIGPGFLRPGPGYGGSCLPKDVAAIAEAAVESGLRFRLAQTVIEVNENQKDRIVTRSREIIGGFENKTIAMLGLAFKPDTDDIRESPAIHIASKILKECGEVKGYDPAAMDRVRATGIDIQLCSDSYEACQGSDLILIMTEWGEFQHLDYERLRSVVRSPVIYDTRNICNMTKVKKQGFKYLCTGRTATG